MVGLVRFAANGPPPSPHVRRPCQERAISVAPRAGTRVEQQDNEEAGQQRSERGPVSLDRAREKKRLGAALGGDAKELRALIAEWTPIIQARVARVLLRGGGASRGALLRRDVEDMVQGVFESLFANDGRVLRNWDPGAGLALTGWVAMIAEREAISAVRTKKRNPMTEAPTDADTLDRRESGVASMERDVDSRSYVRELYARLAKELSPQGLEMFRALFVEEAEVEDICARLSTTADAVYAWRSRIRKAAARIADELRAEGAR